MICHEPLPGFQRFLLRYSTSRTIARPSIVRSALTPGAGLREMAARHGSQTRNAMANGPENGKWPSPFNQPSGAVIAPGRRILFSDCTLRDGEQQAGVVLDRAAKVAIARALDDLGIYEIEAGTVASSEEDRVAIADMCKLGLKAKISALCRGINADMEQAADLGVWGV